MSKDSSNSIRGIFIILIFCSTFLLGGDNIAQFVPNSQMNMFDTPMKTFFGNFEQLLYVPFFFYSGFGIFETYKNLGKEYAKKVININIKEMEGTKLKKEDEIGMRNDDAQIRYLESKIIEDRNIINDTENNETMRKFNDSMETSKQWIRKFLPEIV